MKETIKQFVARGGSISRVESQKTPEITHVLPVRSTLSMDVVDLATGADLFSENAMVAKPTRKVKIVKQAPKIKAELLPAGLLGLLKSLGDNTDAAGQQEEDVREG